MSTKATITYGENFHLYADACDDDHVWLRMENVEYEARNDGVTLAIPLHIWEHIRSFPVARLDLADKTDEELRALAERGVCERVEMAEKEKLAVGRARMASLFGYAKFGSLDDPVEKQIASGIEWLRTEQARQREVRQQIERLREASAQHR